ncbi:MAG: hypothetical protein ACMXYD_05320 [Candidatus Woesearchaeota archaeon]
MIEPRLIPYIKENQAGGHSREEITEALTQAGYEEEVITATIKHIDALVKKQEDKKHLEIVVASCAAAILLIALLTILLWPTTLSEEALEEGRIFTLAQQESIRFSLLNTKHSLTLDSYTDTQAVVRIQSNPLYVTVVYGEDARVDVTGDDVYDLLLQATLSEGGVELSVRRVYEAVCYENWNCTEFSACRDGNQTRECTDRNACGTEENKPETTQTCTCEENWQCTDFSACEAGVQQRVCIDSNDCGSVENRPAITAQCSCDEDWQCTAWSACVDDTKTRTCADRNECGTEHNKPATVMDSCTCEEEWVCINTSACVDGNQTQECVDKNTCSTEIHKPPSVVSCTCEPEWECEAWEVCEGETQQRYCYDSNLCGDFSTIPTEERACPQSKDCAFSIHESSDEYACLVSQASLCAETTLVHTAQTRSSSGFNQYSTTINISLVYTSQGCLYSDEILSSQLTYTQEYIEYLQQEEGIAEETIQQFIQDLNATAQATVGQTQSCYVDEEELTDTLTLFRQTGYNRAIIC